MRLIKIGIDPKDKIYSNSLLDKAIKEFFYICEGLAIFDKFKNLVLVIFAAYFFLKFNNYWYLPLMFIICLPIFRLFGWFNVNYMKKIIDYLNTKFGSHYGIQMFDYTKGSYEVLKNIEKKLNER
jgi:hypothetical protein